MGAGAFFYTLSFGTSPKRELYEEWARAGP